MEQRDGAGAAAECGTDALLKNFDRGAGEVHERNASKQAVQVAPWNSLTIEGKIDRLAEALRVVAGQQELIGAAAFGAQSLVRSHGHGPQGVMKPVDCYLNEPQYSAHPMRHVLALLR